MADLLLLHRLAASRGDGLHPRLLALFEERARQAADPRLACLAAARQDDLAQAGPCPRPPLPDDLPANVVRFPPAAVVRPARRKRLPAS